ncbi:hypothetical protein PIGHUM_03313 [Pigmentiphaga humi]|uniref:Glycosyl transferases group 1 n=1 Tax=Pigmentiphaga humi TaxID=2478468 RepID=A0A3P4B5B3_9BURK|nr:glycosyltransferase [Pigmentiphaga humi]VCU71232.1 hypothetical protein PIGHUM_03313 [Pigmentiphaga humi]
MPKHHILWLHNDSRHGENYGNHLQRVVRAIELWRDDHEFEASDAPLSSLDACDRALAADILVIVQLGQPPVEGIIRERKRLGRPTVFEINDDISQIGDWLPSASLVHSPLWRQRVLNNAHACDAVQFASEGQARRFAVVHERRWAADPYVPVPDVLPAKPDGFVLGWAGTSTHLDDLLHIAPALADFLQRHPDARFAAMGNEAGLRPVLAQLPPGQVSQRPFGDYPAFQDFLSGLHVGLGPLLDTGFNRGRSDGKFAQYAAAGAVAVLSDHPVFGPHRDRALLFATPRQLTGHLDHLHANPARRSDMARIAFDWVGRHRSPAAIRSDLRRRFHALLGGRPPSPPHRRNDAFEEAANLLERAHAARRLGRHDEALRDCRRLLAADAQCHAARWLALSILYERQDYEQVLALADEASDAPCHHDHVAALALASASRAAPSRKAELLQRIRCEALRLRLSDVRPGQLESRWRAVLRDTPFDHFALFGLIGLLRRHTPQSAELHRLLDCADLLDPRAVANLKQPACA